MKLGDFLTSKAGKHFFNIMYSWGACLMIIGATCKIVNVPNANIFLMVGMGMEILIFFIAGFEVPEEEYKWENVFPSIKDENAEISVKKMDELTAKIAKLSDESVEKINSSYQAQIAQLSQQIETISKLNESLSRMQVSCEDGLASTGDLKKQFQQMSSQLESLNSKCKKMANAFGEND